MAPARRGGTNLVKRSHVSGIEPIGALARREVGHREQRRPAMISGRAARGQGLVVAAPHDGHDLSSGDIALRIAQKSGWGLVLARHYRVLSGERWYNVNRPTEGIDEQPTAGASRVYALYERALLAAGGCMPLEVLIEIHGMDRREPEGGAHRRVNVVEIVATGMTVGEQRRVRSLLTSRWAALGAPTTLQFEFLGLASGGRYFYRPLRRWVSFAYRCVRARTMGSLRRSTATRGLHVELPRSLRNDPRSCEAIAEVLAELAVELFGALQIPSAAAPRGPDAHFLARRRTRAVPAPRRPG